MRRILLCLAIGAAVIVPGAAAPARPQSCTEGDAKGLFQVFPHAFLLSVRGVDAPQLVDSFERCQYRVFFDGATFTFSEDDVILGGVIWFSDYAAQGIARSEGIAQIDAIEDRVWIDGVEQTLERTAYKDILHPVFGHSVFQHRAITIQLPAGEHISSWESFDPVFGGATATVRLVITPSP